jgi:hypothetical protein
MPRCQRAIAILLLLLLLLLLCLLLTMLLLILLLLLRLHQHQHGSLEVKICFWVRVQRKWRKLFASTSECGCVSCCGGLPQQLNELLPLQLEAQALVLCVIDTAASTASSNTQQRRLFESSDP